MVHAFAEKKEFLKSVEYFSLFRSIKVHRNIGRCVGTYKRGSLNIVIDEINFVIILSWLLLLLGMLGKDRLE